MSHQEESVPEVDREAARALAIYRQIADQIRQRIIDGELEPGDDAPSVRNVVQTYDVATLTAHRALRILRDEGYLQTRPGRPSVIRLPEAQATDDE